MFKNGLDYDMKGRELYNATHKHSAETRAKISDAQRNMTPEQKAAKREKLQAAHLGRKQSAETRAKRSAALKGKPSPKKGIPSPKKGIPPQCIAATSKPIIYDGVEYPSYAAAKRATGRSHKTIKKYAIEVDNT
jgi:hypothetical protein